MKINLSIFIPSPTSSSSGATFWIHSLCILIGLAGISVAASKVAIFWNGSTILFNVVLATIRYLQSLREFNQKESPAL